MLPSVACRNDKVLWFCRGVAFRIILIRVVRVDTGVDGDGGEWRIEQVPGFTVFFQTHFFGFAVRIEAKHGSGRADFYRNDIPDVEFDDVGGEEVDVTLGVDGASFAGGVGGAGFVGSGAEGVGALDLDAEEVDLGLGAIVEDEVVALAVSPRLADAEGALGGLIEERGFGALSGALGVGEIVVVGFGGAWGVRRVAAARIRLACVGIG